MPPKIVCEDCDGTGQSVEVERSECKNCNGTGGVASGRGSGRKFVCPVCDGQGEQVRRITIACPRCKGEGKIAAKAAPNVVGKESANDKAKPKAKESVAPTAGSRSKARKDEDDDEEEEERPKKLKKKRDKDEDEEEDSDLEDPKPKKKQKPKPKPKPKPKDEDEVDLERRGIWWEPDVGLVIQTTIRKKFLLNSVGAFFGIVGFILLLNQEIILAVFGAILLFIGVAIIGTVNKDYFSKLIMKQSSDDDEEGS